MVEVGRAGRTGFEPKWPPLASHWDLGRYAGLTGGDVALIAGVLYRNFTRGRDDVTVVVAREMHGEDQS